MAADVLVQSKGHANSALYVCPPIIIDAALIYFMYRATSFQ